jgi:putative tricarboxylic transport membrane protein
MELLPAIILLTAMYVSGTYGGAFTAILFRIPGEPIDVPLLWDGYTMARKGQPAKALGWTLFSALGGGLVMVMVMVLASAPVAKFALTFSSPEYFAIIIFGLASVVSLGGGSITNAAISLMLGLLIATVGVDSIYGAERFAFGVPFLQDGIEYLLVMVGAYGLGEVFTRMEKGFAGDGASADTDRRIKTEFPTLAEMIKLKATFLRSSLVGIVVGIIPGAGATVASFVAYGAEGQYGKRGKELGSGIAEGIIAPQTAATSSVGGAMIPLLTMGIPGSGATAIILGAFLLHGMQPGPQVFVTSGPFVYAVFASMFLGVIGMCILGYFAIKPLVKVLELPEAVVSAFVVMFCFIGAFAARNNLSDLYVITAFGILGYLFEKFKFPHRADGAGRHPRPARGKLLHDHDGQPRQRLDGADGAADQRHGDGAGGGRAGVSDTTPVARKNPAQRHLAAERQNQMGMLIEAARAAQRRYETWDQAGVDAVVAAAGWAIMEPGRNRALAEMAVRDTGLGVVEDKVTKNHRKTLGLLRDLKGAKSVGVIAEYPERGIVEIARPVGVVAAITPSTNPGATPANKIINALKGRNAVIVAPSPKGASTCAALVGYVNASWPIGAPLDLVQMLPAPITKDATHALMRQSDLVVATGSQANVRAAYTSGTPAFGVGAGNVASIIDASANLADAAAAIARSKTFDNATSCSSENSVVILDAVHAGAMFALAAAGGVLLDAARRRRLQAAMWPEGKLAAQVTAQDAPRIAQIAGLEREALQRARF